MKHSINNSDSRITRQMFLRLYSTKLIEAVMPHLSSLVSTLLIGNFLPQIALTAVGFTSPIRLIISTFYCAVTFGSSILCSRALGRCDADGMNRIFSVSMTLLSLFGMFLSFVGLTFSTQIALLLGATDEALTLTATYIRSLSIGYLPMLLVYGLMVFFPIANDAQYAMYSSVVLAASNLLFGCLNAKVFHGGIFGMGLANSLGQFVTLAFLLARFPFNKSLMRFRINGKFLQTAKQILRFGIPTSVNQLTNAASDIVVVALIPKLGGLDAVAAYGVYSSLWPLFNAPSNAISRACTAIFGLYVDLKDSDTQKKVLRCTAKYGTIFTLIDSLLLLATAKPLALLLGAEGDVLSTSIQLLLIFAVYLIVILPERLFSSSHECFGHIHIQNIKNLFVCCIFPIVFAYGLGTLFGINGMWFCYMISDSLAVFFYYAYTCKTRKMPPKSFWDMCLTEDTADYGIRMNLTIHTMDEVVRVSQNVIAFCKENGIDAKHSYLCGLCLEELSGNIVAHGFSQSKRKDNHIDIFLRILDGEILVRLCDNAPGFDPMRKLGAEDASDPMKNFGIRMVRRVAKTMEYKPTYGMNVISITL